MTVTEQYTGSRGAIGLGVESAFGTVVAAADYVRFVSETLEEEPGWTVEQSIRNTRQKNSVLVGGPSHALGNIVYSFGPSNGMLLLAAAHGTAPAPSGGGDPYAHTFDTAEDGLPSLTIVKTLARGSSFHMFVSYAGCLVSRWGLRAAVDSPAQVTAEIVGQRGVIDTSTAVVASPTVPVDQPFTLKDLSVQFGSGHTTDATARSFELNLNNDAQTDHTFSGHQYPSLVYAGDRDIAGSVVVALTSASLLTDAIAGTSGVLRALFQVTTTAGAAVTPTRSVLFDIPNVVWGRPSQPLQQGRRIVQTLPFTIFMPSGFDLQTKVTNSRSTAYIP